MSWELMKRYYTKSKRESGYNVKSLPYERASNVLGVVVIGLSLYRLVHTVYREKLKRTSGN